MTIVLKSSSKRVINYNLNDQCWLRQEVLTRLIPFSESSSNRRRTQLNDLGHKTITKVSIVEDLSSTIDTHARTYFRASPAGRVQIAGASCAPPHFFHRRPGGIPPQQTLSRVIIQVATHSEQNTRSKNIIFLDQLKQRGQTDFPDGLSFIVELRLVEDE